jgi:hypothetical protein
MSENLLKLSAAEHLSAGEPHHDVSTSTVNFCKSYSADRETCEQRKRQISLTSDIRAARRERDFHYSSAS